MADEVRRSIRIHEGEYAACKLKRPVDMPAKGFVSQTVTPFEVSLVCLKECTPKGVISMSPVFALMSVEGTLEFSLTGILSAILTPLADAGISVLPISTFDTDYILVPHDKLDAAISALSSRYEFVLPGGNAIPQFLPPRPHLGPRQ